MKKTDILFEATVEIMNFGLGSILACILSSAINHSFWWGFLHFWCSWLYVLWWAVMYTNAIEVFKGM